MSPFDEFEPVDDACLFDAASERATGVDQCYPSFDDEEIDALFAGLHSQQSATEFGSLGRLLGEARAALFEARTVAISPELAEFISVDGATCDLGAYDGDELAREIALVDVDEMLRVFTHLDEDVRDESLSSLTRVTRVQRSLVGAALALAAVGALVGVQHLRDNSVQTVAGALVVDESETDEDGTNGSASGDTDSKSEWSSGEPRDISDPASSADANPNGSSTGDFTIDGPTVDGSSDALASTAPSQGLGRSTTTMNSAASSSSVGSSSRATSSASRTTTGAQDGAVQDGAVKDGAVHDGFVQSDSVQHEQGQNEQGQKEQGQKEQAEQGQGQESAGTTTARDDGNGGASGTTVPDTATATNNANNAVSGTNTAAALDPQTPSTSPETGPPTTGSTIVVPAEGVDVAAEPSTPETVPVQPPVAADASVDDNPPVDSGHVVIPDEVNTEPPEAVSPGNPGPIPVEEPLPEPDTAYPMTNEIDGDSGGVPPGEVQPAIGSDSELSDVLDIEQNFTKPAKVVAVLDSSDEGIVESMGSGRSAPSTAGDQVSTADPILGETTVVSPSAPAGGPASAPGTGAAAPTP